LYVAGNVTGTGSLVKSGLGVVDLQGDNSYTGNTTVSNGTLILRFPFLAATSTVSVHTNALLGNNGVLNLNFPGSETNTVAALVLGGVSKPEGVYSATTDPGYLAGTGSLHVAVVVATNPTNIQFSVSGNILSLSWPSDHLGWTLQTNAVSVVTPASWFPYPGSPLVTNVDISINPAATNVFFRLVYP
jgi:autotransporter-associated beta strand protein